MVDLEVPAVTITGVKEMALALVDTATKAEEEEEEGVEEEGVDEEGIEEEGMEVEDVEVEGVKEEDVEEGMFSCLSPLSSVGLWYNTSIVCSCPCSSFFLSLSCFSS